MAFRDDAEAAAARLSVVERAIGEKRVQLAKTRIELLEAKTAFVARGQDKTLPRWIVYGSIASFGIFVLSNVVYLGGRLFP